jgi:hypothetical protein
MKRNATAAVLLTSCLAISACGPDREVVAEALRPDRTNPERFVCEPAGTRPGIPEEYAVNWTDAIQARTVRESVDAARLEHRRYVSSIRTREGVVAGYIVALEGKHFVCFNNMAWQRDYYSRLPDGEAAGN